MWPGRTESRTATSLGARVYHHATASAGRNEQPPEPVLPAGAVVADVGGRQAAVREYDHRVVGVRGQRDLDGRCAGRQRVAARKMPQLDTARYGGSTAM